MTKGAAQPQGIIGICITKSMQIWKKLPSSAQLWIFSKRTLLSRQSIVWCKIFLTLKWCILMRNNDYHQKRSVCWVVTCYHELIPFERNLFQFWVQGKDVRDFGYRSHLRFQASCASHFASHPRTSTAKLWPHWIRLSELTFWIFQLQININ